jgi:ribosomal protein S15P/S13E
MKKKIEQAGRVVALRKKIIEKKHLGYWLILVIFSWIGSGCSSIQSSVSEGLAQSLSTGISNSADIEMVKAGIPSYLLMIDGMILEDPENTGLYIAGVKLYSTLANFVKDDTERFTYIVDKSYEYSKKLLCLTKEEWCSLSEQTYDVFRQSIDQIDEDDVDILYLYGTSWAGHIEAHKSDMNAIANLPKIKATMHRILQVNESYDRGGAHLYLGVLESLIPPALGGKPEIAKQHFDRTVEINKGRHMMASVMYAEYYTRILFNRELHDQLLKKVLSEDPVEEGLTLANTLAQQRAKKLLESAEEYF